jgi:hypothetical protein
MAATITTGGFLAALNGLASLPVGDFRAAIAAKGLDPNADLLAAEDIAALIADVATMASIAIPGAAVVAEVAGDADAALKGAAPFLPLASAFLVVGGLFDGAPAPAPSFPEQRPRGHGGGG